MQVMREKKQCPKCKATLRLRSIPTPVVKPSTNIRVDIRTDDGYLIAEVGKGYAKQYFCRRCGYKEWKQPE